MSESGPPADLVREFVIAAHGDLQKVQTMLAADPRLVDVPHMWSSADAERPIQAAAQTGAKNIAEYLLSKGAPLEICTAAVLGRNDQLERMLSENPSLSKATGAHGIPLLPHAVQSQNIETVKLVLKHAATDGSSMALHFAVAKGDKEMVSFLLANTKPDFGSKNYQGKTALTISREKGFKEVESVLLASGAKE